MSDDRRVHVRSNIPRIVRFHLDDDPAGNKTWVDATLEHRPDLWEHGPVLMLKSGYALMVMPLVGNAVAVVDPLAKP